MGITCVVRRVFSTTSEELISDRLSEPTATLIIHVDACFLYNTEQLTVQSKLETTSWNLVFDAFSFPLRVHTSGSALAGDGLPEEKKKTHIWSRRKLGNYGRNAYVLHYCVCL